jgi:hypothetical protein
VKYLVDAHVLSEPTKAKPDPRVVAWLRAHESEIAVDPVILGELRFGILILPKGRKRTALERWFDAGVRLLHCLPGTPTRDENGQNCWPSFARPGKPCRSKIASLRRPRSSTVSLSWHGTVLIS